MSKGILIAVDGLDGSGKETQSFALILINWASKTGLFPFPHTRKTAVPL